MQRGPETAAELELEASGPDLCEACGCSGASEIAYVCVACDGPVCEVCVVLVGAPAEAWCPACAPARRREDG